jgi:hypothetical protein
VTDGTWKAWSRKLSGWDERKFDDSAWPGAVVVAQLGDQPWGPIGSPDLNTQGPQSAGIPGQVRLTYVPHAEPVVLRNLGAGAAWRATIFDPASGKESKPTRVTATADGTFACPPPKGSDHDWILILES